MYAQEGRQEIEKIAPQAGGPGTDEEQGLLLSEGEGFGKDDISPLADFYAYQHIFPWNKQCKNGRSNNRFLEAASNLAKATESNLVGYFVGGDTMEAFRSKCCTQSLTSDKGAVAYYGKNCTPDLIKLGTNVADSNQPCIYKYEAEKTSKPAVQRLSWQSSPKERWDEQNRVNEVVRRQEREEHYKQMNSRAQAAAEEAQEPEEVTVSSTSSSSFAEKTPTRDAVRDLHLQSSSPTSTEETKPFDGGQSAASLEKDKGGQPVQHQELSQNTLQQASSTADPLLGETKAESSDSVSPTTSGHGWAPNAALADTTTAAAGAEPAVRATLSTPTKYVLQMCLGGRKIGKMYMLTSPPTSLPASSPASAPASGVAKMI